MKNRKSDVKRGVHAGEPVYGFHENDIHVWTHAKDRAAKSKLHQHFEASRQRQEVRDSKEVGTQAHLRRVRGDWFDDQSKAANTAKVSVFADGMGIRIERRQAGYSWAGGGEGEGGGKRGKIKGFTSSSGRRFMDRVLQIPKKSVPVMVTLTYPFMVDPERVKLDLKAFSTALVRRYKKACGFWKLEFTEKGVPHYHLLVYGAKPWKGWIAKTWWRIVGTGDVKHLRAGTRVEALRSHRGTLSYVGKKYLTKAVKAPVGDWGRYWGIFNRGALPVGRVVEDLIPGRLGMWISRTIRRYLKAQGKGKHGARGRVFWIMTEHTNRWLECFEYLEKLEAVQPVVRCGVI